MIDSDMVDEILNKALYTWGIEKQSFMAIEEMAELTKEILKSYRRGSVTITYPIIEEMVDVQVMLIQMRMAFNADDEEHYQFVFDSKIRRLQKYIEEVDGNETP